MPDTRASETRRAILDAAADVVRTDGAARLTLEHVAATAGVSKGGLLYHYGTKQALIVALLGDALQRADDVLADSSDALPAGPGRFAHAYLDFVRDGRHAEGVGTGLFAASFLDDGDLSPAQEVFAGWQERLTDDDGLDPVVGLLVRVVADGLWFIDLFDLAPPADAERAALFELVGAIVDRRG